jgi:hypothetical protein
MSVPHPQALLMMQQQQQMLPQSARSETNHKENESSKEELNRYRRRRHVKHPMSAYVFYVAECKARLQHSRPDLSFGEIARIIGANWQKLSPTDREKVYMFCRYNWMTVLMFSWCNLCAVQCNGCSGQGALPE